MTLTNASRFPIILREVRLVGPTCDPPPFSLSAGAPESEFGVIVPATSEHELTIRCVAPEERGLSRQWIFALIEATEADERTVRIAHFALGATLCMYTFHSTSLEDLSAEAPPFFPDAWRSIWSTPPLVSHPAPPPNFPAFTRVYEIKPPVRMLDAPADDPSLWDLEATRLEWQQEIASKSSSPTSGSPNRSWDELHLARMRRLLHCEERQQAIDYDKMDVFSTTATAYKPSRRNTNFLLTIDVPGLQEQHPPLMGGDAVIMRPQDLTNLEVGMRVVNVTARTVLVLQLSITRTRLQVAAATAAMDDPYCSPMAPPGGSISVDGTILDANGEPVLGHDGRPLVHSGVASVFELTSLKTDEHGRSTGGSMLCHLRFLLNRSMMQYMQHTLASVAAFKLGPGVSSVHVPTIVKVMSPKKADLITNRMSELFAKLVVRRNVDEALKPIQPQINPEQMQAVGDILGNHYGALPYLVFGPPGTGKTLVMIETVLQALVHVDEPRVLVCAPSNAAADVLASRLASLLPEVRRCRKEMGADDKHFPMLRLNSQQRTMGEVKSELLAYCATDQETAMFTVPPLQEIRRKNVIVATCGATHLLAESGLLPVHSKGYVRGARAAVQAAKQLEGGGHFTHILIDEASQGLEAELMLPLSFAYPGASTALCGDHKQLGPVVRSAHCRSHGLAVSMLERLIELPVYQQHSSGDAAPSNVSEPNDPTPELPRCMTKLVRNYRSHRALLELPSRVSYNNELREHGDRDVTGSMSHWEELKADDFPLLFYGQVCDLLRSPQISSDLLRSPQISSYLLRSPHISSNLTLFSALLRTGLSALPVQDRPVISAPVELVLQCHRG